VHDLSNDLSIYSVDYSGWAINDRILMPNRTKANIGLPKGDTTMTSLYEHNYRRYV
jgi:hypothetical protein